TGPRGAQLSLQRHGGLVTVTVRARTSAPGSFPLPGFTVGGSAVAEVER
ncbi:MAG: hypothetical protein H0X00_23590, partial [Sporichthya sp.]|nr:hypothetical protein [Sporichthya sp.]